MPCAPTPLILMVPSLRSVLPLPSTTSMPLEPIPLALMMPLAVLVRALPWPPNENIPKDRFTVSELPPEVVIDPELMAVELVSWFRIMPGEASPRVTILPSLTSRMLFPAPGANPRWAFIPNA